jgi:fumarate hydratase subunit beta
MSKKITLPLNDEILKDLRVGDNLLLTGVVYTARDAAHKRMLEALDQGKPLPFDVKGATIYYMGPTPARPGMIAMIGKGSRSEAVKDAMMKCKAVYLGAIGGAGALLSGSIRKAEVIAYEELGTEALRRLEVEDFPVTVVNDIYGGDLYEEGKAKYQDKAPE